MGCWPHRQWPYLLCHSAGPMLAFAFLLSMNFVKSPHLTAGGAIWGEGRGRVRVEGACQLCKSIQSPETRVLAHSEPYKKRSTGPGASLGNWVKCRHHWQQTLPLRGPPGTPCILLCFWSFLRAPVIPRLPTPLHPELRHTHPHTHSMRLTCQGAFHRVQPLDPKLWQGRAACICPPDSQQPAPSSWSVPLSDHGLPKPTQGHTWLSLSTWLPHLNVSHGVGRTEHTRGPGQVHQPLWARLAPAASLLPPTSPGWTGAQAGQCDSL